MDVVFNLTGFQCVEYALRYFYFMTGITTTHLDANGDDVARELYYTFHAKNPQLGLVPLTTKRSWQAGQSVGVRIPIPSQKGTSSACGRPVQAQTPTSRLWNK
jgi:hypothetical protein